MKDSRQLVPLKAYGNYRGGTNDSQVKNIGTPQILSKTLNGDLVLNNCLFFNNCVSIKDWLIIIHSKTISKTIFNIFDTLVMLFSFIFLFETAIKIEKLVHF